jgi:hypothetical protein
MATVITAHEVSDTVYHVSADTGVRKGTVKSVEVRITDTTTINYNIQFINTSDGSIKALEGVVFDDVDVALAAYKLLVE